MQSLSRVIKGTQVTDNAVVSPPDAEKILSPAREKTENKPSAEDIQRPIIEEAQIKALEIIKSAKVEADKITSAARQASMEMGERAKQEGFQAGYAQGYQEGYQFALEEASCDAQDIREKADLYLRSCTDEVRLYIKQSQEDIVLLARDMARQIINAEITANPEVVCSIAQNIVSRSIDKRHIVLKVNPENFSVVKAKREELSMYAEEPGNIFIIADSGITPGSIRAESPSGFIDGDIEVQLEVLIKSLLGE